jgi:hypothetical protein
MLNLNSKIEHGNIVVIYFTCVQVVPKSNLGLFPEYPVQWFFMGSLGQPSDRLHCLNFSISSLVTNHSHFCTTFDL